MDRWNKAKNAGWIVPEKGYAFAIQVAVDYVKVIWEVVDLSAYLKDIGG